MPNDKSKTTDLLPMSPMVNRSMNRFHVKRIERRVNECLSGEATVGELVNIMIEMGWQPPHRAVTEVCEDGQ